MIHEPRRFLRDVQVTRDLIAAHAVFAVGDEPDRSEPLVQTDRRVLEYRAYLSAELLLGVFGLALPDAPRLKEIDFLAAAGRTLHTARPANIDHEFQASVGVCEVENRFLQCPWCVHAIDLAERHW